MPRLKPFPAVDAMAIFDALASDWHKPRQVSGWNRIRARFDRGLTQDEIWLASGAIGYALRQHMRVTGRDLSEPVIMLEHGNRRGERVTVLFFEYDSSASARSNPEAATVDAFEAAAEYVRQGSPIRQTEKQGTGTAGTRLCPGIGAVGVTFDLQKAE